jgi:putative RecB family exonuclease
VTSPTFSNSRLQTLDDCPRRYAFRYVEGLREAFQTIEAFLGTMAHEALQWLYLEREAARAHEATTLVERFRESWRQKLGPGVKVVREGTSAARYEEDGADMLRRHHAGAFRADRLETLAVEPKIHLDVEGNAYVGYIDRLARDGDGTLHVIDYKTGRPAATLKEAGPQVRAYGLAVLEERGGVEIALSFQYLRTGASLEERFTRAQGGELVAGIGARIRRALEAEARGEFPARPSPLCRWCGFREICEASPFRVRSAPAPERSAPLAAAPEGACPRCGGGLVLRSGSRSSLVACARYPECSWSREASSSESRAGR